MEDALSKPTRQFPVLQTVTQSMLFSLTSPGFLVRISWLWMLIIAAPGLVIQVLLYVFSSPDAEQTAGGKPNASTNNGALEGGQADSATTPVILILEIGYWVFILVFVVAICSIAVSWHRHVLLGETPNWLTLRVGRRELLYLGYGLVISVVCGLMNAVVFGVVNTFRPPFGNSAGIEFAGVVIMVAVTLMVFVRLHLVLPGTAVSDRRISLRHTLDLTGSDSWQIAGGFLLIMPLYLIPEALLQIIPTESSSPTGAAVATFYLMLTVHLFLGSIVLSYMSYCYSFFVPPPDEGDLAE